MEELEAQVKKLTSENEKLKEQVAFWRNQEKKARECIKGFQEKYGDIIPGVSPSGSFKSIIDLSTIEYIDKARPILRINKACIQFEKSTDKTAEIARIIFTPNHLKKLQKGFIPVAEIYEWFKYSEAWENLSHKEREKFRDDFYQWLYRLNQKIAPTLNNRKMFEMVNHEYRISPRVSLIKPRK